MNTLEALLWSTCSPSTQTTRVQITLKLYFLTCLKKAKDTFKAKQFYKPKAEEWTKSKIEKREFLTFEFSTSKIDSKIFGPVLLLFPFSFVRFPSFRFCVARIPILIASKKLIGSIRVYLEPKRLVRMPRNCLDELQKVSYPGCRRSSVDSSAPSILPSRVRIPSTPSFSIEICA